MVRYLGTSQMRRKPDLWRPQGLGGVVTADQERQTVRAEAEGASNTHRVGVGACVEVGDGER